MIISHDIIKENPELLTVKNHKRWDDDIWYNKSGIKTKLKCIDIALNAREQLCYIYHILFIVGHIKNTKIYQK